MNVPLLDLKHQHDFIHDEIMHEIELVIKSNHYILGPKVVELENKIAEYCDTKYAVGVSSGSDALLASLMALDIGKGDEVITTPFTFFATVGAILRVGAKPIFVDIDPKTYNIDAEKIEEKITEKTKAIVPVHLYGQACDMDLIMTIANKNNIYVIEDAAQALGTTFNSQPVGSFGELGCFSFFPSKNLGAFGDGGIITTNDKDLYEKLKTLRSHGSKPKYFHSMVGGNFRLDAIQAAILLVKFKHLEWYTNQRQQNATSYVMKFIDYNLSVDYFNLQLNNSAIDSTHIYNQFTIQTESDLIRDNVREYLSEHNVSTEIYYPQCMHLQKCILDLYPEYKEGDFPIAEKASQTTISLPIYPGLNEQQINHVVETISNYYHEFDDSFK